MKKNKAGSHLHLFEKMSFNSIERVNDFQFRHFVNEWVDVSLQSSLPPQSTLFLFSNCTFSLKPWPKIMPSEKAPVQLSKHTCVSQYFIAKTSQNIQRINVPAIQTTALPPSLSGLASL